MRSLPSLANERGAHQPGGGGQRRESLREGKRLKPREGGKGREPHTRAECTPALAPARTRLSLAQWGRQFYSGVGMTGILNVWISTVPALLMAGLAPFSAHNRFPPKGTYCWDEGRLSVFRSCLLCLSRRMECTAFKNSFLLSGELWKEDLHLLAKQHWTHDGTSDVIGYSQTNIPEDQRLKTEATTPISLPTSSVFTAGDTEHVFPSLYALRFISCRQFGTEQPTNE